MNKKGNISVSSHTGSKPSLVSDLILNKNWNMDWGGLFMYMDDKKIYAEKPEYNKLIYLSGDIASPSPSILNSSTNG